MSFIVRSAKHEDVGQLLELARQFPLLNLPDDKNLLGHKIDRSAQSFANQMPKDKAEYLFVLEDTEEQAIVGSSLIIAKHGSEDAPHCFFKVLKKDHFSQNLGIGFIHQVLRFQMDTEGPTEIGGLLIDRSYRRRPERLGKQISLARFLYMGIYPERFEDRVLCELTPPLTDEGRSEFWEALGRRFTGLNYQEADMLSQSHKEFIESLFPEDDIYLCLLDPKARLVLGRVGEATKPAQHLLESIGFQYLEEVDPFDGGPHYGSETSEILPIKKGRRVRLADFSESSFVGRVLIGTTQEEFKSTLVPYDLREDEIAIPHKIRRELGLEIGEEIFMTPFDYAKRKEQT
ncbi:MAG: arginine N-succinyltransferase [Bdellovibrionaceae bacterium]|nr:arginine N-succinyltransferase [Pseudobdellovibrionaceae bacterium]